MTRCFPLVLLLSTSATLAVAQTPAPTATTAPAAAQHPSGRTRAFLDPLGKLWEVPGQDGLDVWFAATDLNHDGFIDRAEITAAAKAWFATLDLNHDGVIDPDEEIAYEADRTGGHGALLDPTAAARDEGGEDRRPHGKKRGHAADLEDRTGALMDVANPVISADLNMDRGVSLVEAVSAATRRLALLDINGDGKLSLDEARQRRASQQSTKRERENTRPADQQPSDPSNPAGN